VPTPPLPKSVYEETARLFFEYGGSVTAAARASGVGYQTYASRLKKARELGLADKAASSNAEEKERIVTAKVVLKPTYRIQQRKSKPDETKRVLAIGDCHDGPNLPDKTRFYAMGRYAKDNQVDQIIQIGDFASVDSLNRFDGNETLKGKEKPSFGQDMQSFQEAIRAFHKGLDGYDVPKHVTLGNHEDRIWSYTNKNPEIVNMLDQILFATMDDYGWTYSPYGEFYFIGDVGFTHAPLNTMGKAYGGMQSENQIARDAMHDIVYGHTHKRLDKTFPKIGNQFVNIINLGTSLPEGHIEEYARHTLTGWSYGVYDIQIKDGKIYETNWLPMGKLMKDYGEGYAGD
jgi:transposase-like protein